MYSNEIRRDAISRSIETGLPLLSKKVVLIQENGIDEQFGFLLYVPLYKKAMSIRTKEEKYKAIKGFVFAVFRAKDFINGAVGPYLNIVDIKMYDETNKNSNELLYDSHINKIKNNTLTKNLEIELDGQTWVFEISLKNSVINIQSYNYAYIFILLGLIITSLISFIIKKNTEKEILKDDILFNISQGVLVTDTNRKIIYVNKAFEELTGYTRESVFDKNNKLKRYIGLQNDITDTILAAESQNKYQKQLELSAEISGLAFWEYDFSKKMFTFNHGVYVFLGTSLEKEKSYNMDLELYLDTQTKEKILSCISDAYTKKKDFQNTIEHSIMRKDAIVIEATITYYIRYNLNNTPYKIYGTTFDFTKQKEKENALINSENKAQNLLEEQNTLLSLFNEGEIVLFKWKNDELWNLSYVSSSVEKLLGYSKEDMLSHEVSYTSCIHKKDKFIVSEEVAVAVQKNSNFFVYKPYRIITKNNETKWVLDYTVTQKDSNGKVLYFIGYVIDITDQKNLENNLIQAKEQAERALKSKSEFLSNMSHEIRTPLNGIIGLTQLMFQTPLNEIQKNYLSKSIISSEALLHVINDILDYSKIEANKIELEHIPFELDTMLHNLSNLFLYEAESKAIELDCTIAPDVHNNLKGDPFRINQILINLVGNALKFTSQGFIFITVSLSELTENTMKLHFNVKDTGIGISKKKQKKLFQNFSQVDTSNTREYGGSGLGLVISQKLAHLMGGNICVESIEGIGSNFILTTEVEFIKDNYAFLSQDIQNKRVLVVNNNKEMKKMLRETLTLFSLKTVLCNDMHLALKILEKENFDFVITDWELPEQNGVEFAKIIESLYSHRDMKTIIMSAFSKKDALIRVAKESDININTLLIKPFSSSTLLDLLVNNGDVKLIQDHSDKKLFAQGKVLLVEDNAINQLVAKQNLEIFGLKVDIAVNGEIAVQKVRKQNFDIIFMDLQMPIMDGYEATKQIREITLDTPIIALSAAVMEEDIQMTRDVGMNEHLSKPIDIEKLKNVISKYLKTETKEICVTTNIETFESFEGINFKELTTRVNNDKKFAHQMLREFAIEKKDILLELESFDLQSEEFHTFIHTLKGVSGNLSLSDVFHYCTQIYNNKSTDEIKKLRVKLKKSLQIVLSEIDKKYFRIESGNQDCSNICINLIKYKIKLNFFYRTNYILNDPIRCRSTCCYST